MSDSDVWEPWVPEVGQRVRVRLSAECRTEFEVARLAGQMTDDEARRRTLAGQDVFAFEDEDESFTTHPNHIDGVTGVVGLIDRSPDSDGHFYRVLFDVKLMPDAIVGAHLSAAELEPVP